MEWGGGNGSDKLTVFAKQRHKHNADRPRAAVNGGGWLELELCRWQQASYGGFPFEIRTD